MTTLTFQTLAEFHRNRRLRHADKAGEYVEDGHDFGIHWRGPARARYRLTWMGPRYRAEDSAPAGELYLANLAEGSIELLCVIPPTTYEVSDSSLSVAGDPAFNVRAILSGWEEVEDTPNSVDWVRDRVAEAIRADWATAAVPHV